MRLKEAVAVAAIASLPVVLHPGPVQAHHRSNFYCSGTGDICQSTRKVDGIRKLGVLLAGKYFDAFRLCVKDPGGSRSCKRFRVRDHGDGTYGRDVRWRKYFPDGGKGAYTVTWKLTSGERFGKKLGFHRWL